MIRIEPLADGMKAQWEPLWQNYLSFYQVNLAAEVSEHAWATIISKGNSGGFAAFTQTDEMIGFVHYLFHPSTWALDGYCYLEDLFVTKEGRGKGTGRALIEAVYAQADQRGVDRVYWVTDAQNKAAQTLYNKLATKSDYVQYRRDKLNK